MTAPKYVVRPLVAVSVGALVALLAIGCKKKEEPVIPDAAPVATVVVDAAPVDVVTTDDTLDAAVDAAVAVHHGPAVNVNTARIKACCNALRTQAKAMGSSPEGNVILGVATQCDAVAVQAGAAGTAPELAAIKQMMRGKTLPALCQ